MATIAAAEPSVEMEEQLREEREEAGEPVKAMEQTGEERADAGDSAEIMDQIGEEQEEADEPAEAMEEVGKEREEPGEPAEAMEQVGEEQEEAGERAKATEQVEEEREETRGPAEAMEQDGEEREEAEAEAEEGASLQPALPMARVKRIIRVDRDIKKVTTEASLLIAAATELFLGSLAAGAHAAAARRGRRSVRAAHIRAAARAHRPTADFLLECLPAEEEEPRTRAAAGSSGGGDAKPLPRGTRRIDAFFQKVT